MPVKVTGLSITGPRVRLDACPSCGRTMTLDHCGVIVDGDPYVDAAQVRLAQRLHLRQCGG